MNQGTSERVVVTGIGAVSPLGLSAQESWQNVIRGVSGVGAITLFDPADMIVKIACEVKNFNPEQFMPAREARRRDRFEQFGTAAANQAIEQAGLAVSKIDPSRVGTIISTAMGGITSLVEAIHTLDDSGPRRVSPFLIPMLMVNGASGMVAIDHGFKGPNFCVSSACASGSDAIGVAWQLIKTGVIDTAVAGASEAIITPVGVAAFDRVGAMSRRTDGMTPKPFDLNRDGLVIGEGAAVLVLERESHARQRGAEILAELAGYGASADAYHITAPSESGEGGAEAIRLALQTAGVNSEEVDYVNAHGTGTPLNDAAEVLAIKAALGDHAYHIPVSSTKSMTGHMMGATGAMEVAFCVQAVREGIVPPTINYQTPDPRCDLDVVPNTAREMPVRVAVSNAFGFGGHNAVLVVRRYED